MVRVAPRAADGAAAADNEAPIAEEGAEEEQGRVAEPRASEWPSSESESDDDDDE